MSIAYSAPRFERFGLEKPTRTLTAGAFLSYVALESMKAMHHHAHATDQTEIISQPGEGEQSIYVLPGCRGDGRFIAEHLGPHLADLGPSHTTVYPQRGFSLEHIKEQLLETRQKDERPASFYAMSMGGLVLSQLLGDREFTSKFGRIDTVVFDSSPSDVSDLSDHTMHGVTAAKYVPALPSLSRLYGHAMSRSAEKSIVETPDIDAVLLAHLRATAGTPLSAVKHQTRFMRHAYLGHRSLGNAPVDSIVYMSSAEDDVVNVKRAVTNYRMIYDADIPHVIDETRPNPSHAVGVEHVQSVIDQLRTGGHYGDVVPFASPVSYESSQAVA